MVVFVPTMRSLDGAGKKNDGSSKAAEEEKAEPEKIDFSKVKIEPLFEESVDFETFSKSDFRVILSGIHEYYEPEELVGKTCIAITNLPPRPMMGIDSCGMLISAVHSEEGKEKLHLLMVDNHIPAGAKLY